MERLDDLKTFQELIRILDDRALRAHARRLHTGRGHEELPLIREEFRRRHEPRPRRAA